MSHQLCTEIYLESLKPRFYYSFEICLLPQINIKNNNKYYSNVVNNIIFGITVPDYPISGVPNLFVVLPIVQHS